MKREFTTREKVLLLILVVLMIAVGYYKLILTPINQSVEVLKENIASEQEEINAKLVIAGEINKMQTVIDEIKASGEAHAIPYYDNSAELMKELHSVFLDTEKYHLIFGNQTADGYIMLRPVEMTFETTDYERARNIIDDLYACNSIVKVSDARIDLGRVGSDKVKVTMTLTYYELIVDN